MNRRPLGRGLDALIQSTALGAGSGIADAPSAGEVNRGGIELISLERLRPGRFQPRRSFNQEKLEELAATIRIHGVLEPLIVRPDGEDYELIAGERRLRAARMAGLALVPAIVRELDDRSALLLSLIENLLREDLNPVEEGRALGQLSRQFGLTHEEIASKIGKSRSYVTNIIRLMELPDEVLEMIGRGELTGGQVRPLLALGSAEEQIAEARRIVAEKIPSRDVEEITGSRRRGRSGQGIRARTSTADANLQALTDSIQRALRRKVRIVRQRGKHPGRLELEYYNDEDLTGLARALVSAGRAPAQVSEL